MQQIVEDPHADDDDIAMNKQSTGRQGELIAANYLQQNGYTIVLRNWRCRFGEIDLIAQKDGTLVFVEVRTRHSATSEEAFASIDKMKQTKMARAAQLYLATNDLPSDVDWRIDVIAVILSRTTAPQVAHVEDALGWD